MGVIVRIPQFLQHLTDNVRTIEVTGKTLGECLDEVAKQLPKIKEILFDEDGTLKENIGVLINGKSAFPGEAARRVKNGDVVDIVLALSGG